MKAGDAAQPKLSQLAQKRLMLWVVLDSLRAQVVLSGAAADRAGGRIWKQAQRVSAAISSTAAACASRREAAAAAAGAAAAADPDSQAALVMELAAIDAGEKLRLNELRYEVYTGLHEVHDAAPAPAPHVDRPKPPDTVLTSPDTAIPAPTTSTGVRFPWLIHPNATPPLPADLVASLTPDGLQLLFSGWTDSMQGRDPGEWWSYLPNLVNRLTCELAQANAARRLLELQQYEQLRLLTRAAAASEPADDHRDEMIRECETDIYILTDELAASEAKVEVLSEVLSRKNA